jgi:phage terminase large subunit-like protein
LTWPKFSADREENAQQLLTRFKRFCTAFDVELEEWEARVSLDVFRGVREVWVLIPKGNGKSGWLALLGLFHLCLVERAYVPLGAAAVDQAALVYEEIERFAKHPSIARRVRVQPGYKTARSLQLGGKLKVYSSDGARAHGPGPTLALVDEYWAHQNNGLFVAFRGGLGKRSGQLVGGTTAGTDPKSPLGQLLGRAKRLKDVTHEDALTVYRSADGRFALYEWACREDEDLEDPHVLKRANPASFVTVDWLREQIESPSMHPDEVAQFHANVWTRGGKGWLRPGMWARCLKPRRIPKHADVYLGVDIGLTEDSSAVVTAWPHDGKVFLRASIFDPPGDGRELDLGEVENYIREQARKYRVREVVYDPFMFARSAQTLSDEGLYMVKFPQTNERMAPATMSLYEAIKTGAVEHDGDPRYAEHVNNGVIAMTERGRRVTKRKALGPIDALVATVIVFARSARGVPSIGVEW